MTNLIKAINFATSVHRGQIRKGKPNVPYITHPMAVGILLAHSGANEEIIIAGILHDTIEDCEPYGSITKELIAREFGKEIAEKVNDVTEPDKSLPWAERKQAALDHIPTMRKASLQVKSADVLHNLTDQLEDYKKEGEALFKKFNAPKEDQMHRYDKLITALENADKELPLLPQLKTTFNEFSHTLKNSN